MGTIKRAAGKRIKTSARQIRTEAPKKKRKKRSRMQKRTLRERTRSREWWNAGSILPPAQPFLVVRRAC